MNERLIWMVRDFLLATQEVEVNQKISWMAIVSNLTGGLSSKHSALIFRLMKELFKKY